MKLFRRSLITLLSFTAACSGEAPEPAIGDVTHALFGGTAAEKGAHPEVVSLVTYYPETQDAGAFYDLCSGVLVAPHVVLTAAVCLGPDLVITDEGNGCFTYEAPSSLPTMTAGFGLEVPYDEAAGHYATNLPNQLTVVDVAVPPAGDCFNDLALVVLPAKVAADYATPVTVRSGAVTASEAFTAVGYGPNEDYLDYDTKRFVDGTVSCVEPDCDEVEGAKEAFLSEDAILCLGDFGAPALDASGELVGVGAFTQAPGACDATTEWSGYVHVPDFATWITDTIATFPEPSDSFTPPDPMGTGGGDGGGGMGGGAGVGGMPIGGTGGGGAGANAGEPLPPGGDDGCSCSAPGAPNDRQPAHFLVALGLLVALGRRRRS